MDKIELRSHDPVVDGFPYTLTGWLPTEQELTPFIQPFINQKEEKDGLIIKSLDGWAIYTTGRHVQ